MLLASPPSLVTSRQPPRCCAILALTNPNIMALSSPAALLTPFAYCHYRMECGNSPLVNTFSTISRQATSPLPGSRSWETSLLKRAAGVSASTTPPSRPTAQLCRHQSSGAHRIHGLLLAYLSKMARILIYALSVSPHTHPRRPTRHITALYYIRHAEM